MNSLQELQTLRLANDIRVDALQDDPSPWNFLVPNRNVLYYTFDASPGSLIDLETATSHVAFNGTQQNAARSILAYVSQLIGVTFTEVSSSAQADIHFAATDVYGSSNVSGLNSTYFSYSYSGDEIRSLSAESLVWLDNVQFAADNSNTVAGTQGYETLLHEIGHALGLGHPFEATADSPNNLPVSTDNTNNTVMSYTHAGDWKYTFQSYDVLALTWIYGGDGLGGTWGYNSTQGNTLNPTATDVTPPGLSWSSPMRGASGVALSSNIVLTFDEPVQRGTGNLVLKTAGGTVVEIFNIATNTANLSLSGNLLTVNPSVNLTSSTGYVLEVAAGALKDLSGNSFIGTSLGFTTETYVNSTPTGSVTITGTATQGQTLTATNTLADVDGLGLISYHWKANGSVIPGATGSVYTLTQAEVGKTITVTASYTDGQGTAESKTSSATTAVANVNDAPTGSVTITGIATQGQTLTATNTLADADGLGLISYQWKANGSVITGATGNTHTLTQAEVGKTITVVAGYTDGQGTAESKMSSATTAVANVNDAPTGSVTITGTATQGQTLTATNTLADVDGLGLISYQWKANGAAINGATGSSYTLTQAEVGKTITVTASYTDGQGTAESKTSSATRAVVNINDKPVAGNTTASGPEDTAISGTVNATDIDGEALTYRALTSPQHGSLTLNPNGSYTYTPAANYAGTDSFTFKASDGRVDSNTATVSITVTPVNDAPVVTNALADRSVTLGSSLNFAFAGNTFTDVDNLSLSYTVTLSNGTSLPSWLSFNPTTRTFSGTPTSIDVGQLAIKVTAADPDRASATDTFVLTISAVNEVGGSAASETLTGSASTDRVDAGAGDDRVQGLSGDDILNGGSGTDTAIYSGNAAQYAIRIDRVTGAATVVDTQSQRDGIDTLIGIERLQFGDQTFELFNPARTTTPQFGQTNSFLFDPSYYLLSNPELVPSVTIETAFAHYLSTGAAQGAKPNAWFDPVYYANRWDDLKALNLTADVLFQHYNLYGVWEGRSAGPSYDRYDGNRYLKDNPDVAAYVDANVADFLGSRSNGAVAHYLIYGANEGRVAYDLDGNRIEQAILIGVADV